MTLPVQTLCFRGKCFLTCLYGRVEVMGFTIEEGQESYPLFSPASHCPLTIRALESPVRSRDGRNEASIILQKYLPAGKHMINSPAVLWESDVTIVYSLLCYCMDYSFVTVHFAAARKNLLKRIMSNSAIILLEPMETPLTRFLGSFTDLSELFSPPMVGWLIFLHLAQYWPNLKKLNYTGVVLELQSGEDFVNFEKVSRV